MATSIWFYAGFTAFVLAMLALDLGVFHRNAHVVRTKEAGTWVAIWIALSLLFAALLLFEGSRYRPTLRDRLPHRTVLVR